MVWDSLTLRAAIEIETQVNVTDFGHPLAMREAKAMAMLSGTPTTGGRFWGGRKGRVAAEVSGGFP